MSYRNREARSKHTIKAVFAAECFSKYITADFEGLVSSRSICVILQTIYMIIKMRIGGDTVLSAKARKQTI